MVIRRKKAKTAKPRKSAPKKRKAAVKKRKTAVRKKKAAPRKTKMDKGDRNSVKMIKDSTKKLGHEMQSALQSVTRDIRKNDTKALRKDLKRAKLALAKGAFMKEGLQNALRSRKKRK